MANGSSTGLRHAENKRGLSLYLSLSLSLAFSHSPFSPQWFLGRQLPRSAPQDSAEKAVSYSFFPKVVSVESAEILKCILAVSFSRFVSQNPLLMLLYIL
jgi:hypothetical protein